MGPISYLPPELLDEIFHLSIPNDVLNSFGDRTTPPLSLTQVCKSWRNHVGGEPAFWNSLRLAYRGPPQDMLPIVVMEGFIQKLEFWLQRSKELPFALSVTFPTFPVSLVTLKLPGARPANQATIQQKARFVQTIIESASRFGYLDLDRATMTGVMTSFFQLPPTHLHRLRTLRYVTSFEMGDWTPRQLDRAYRWPATSANPYLQRIYIHEKPVLRFYEYVCAPMSWASITHVAIRNLLATKHALTILGEAPQLEECQFSLTTVSPHESAERAYKLSGPPILLPQLRTLDVEFKTDHNNISLDFFTKLQMPKLNDLAVRLSSQKRDWNILKTKVPGRAALFNQVHNLRSLTLAFIPFSETELIDLLCDTPHLRHLTLHCKIQDYSPLYKALSTKGKGSFDLETLTIFVDVVLPSPPMDVPQALPPVLPEVPQVLFSSTALASYIQAKPNTKVSVALSVPYLQSEGVTGGVVRLEIYEHLLELGIPYERWPEIQCGRFGSEMTREGHFVQPRPWWA